MTLVKPSWSITVELARQQSLIQEFVSRKHQVDLPSCYFDDWIKMFLTRSGIVVANSYIWYWNVWNKALNHGSENWDTFSGDAKDWGERSYHWNFLNPWEKHGEMAAKLRLGLPFLKTSKLYNLTKAPLPYEWKNQPLKPSSFWNGCQYPQIYPYAEGK